MALTDPISDYLTRVRNAIQAKKKTVDIPASKFKLEISKILKDHNFIQDYKVLETANKQGAISLTLKYYNGAGVIKGLRRISKPGIRRFVKYEDLPKVKNGLGIAIVSTSNGLVTDKKARELKVGGEVVCEVW